MKRDHFPLLLVAGIALLGALGAAAIRASDRGSFAAPFSTYRSAPDGTRALFLLAEERIAVQRSTQDLALIDADAKLVLLGVDAPDAGATPLTTDERKALLAHVATGKTLLYAPADAEHDPLLGELDIAAEPTGDPTPRALVPTIPSPYTAGVREARGPLRATLQLPQGALPLLDTDDGEVAMAAVPHGLGEVVVLAAPELFTNAWVAKADNAELALSLLRAMAGPIQFDEYHHGFEQQRSVAQFASRYGLQLAIGQLLLGLCVWAVALRRFGRPRAPVEDERRAAVDALSAISRIYREGGHSEHASKQILRALVHELAPIAKRKGSDGHAAVAASLRVHGRSDLAAALDEVAATAELVGGERGVERSARAAALARGRIGGT